MSYINWTDSTEAAIARLCVGRRMSAEEAGAELGFTPGMIRELERELRDDSRDN